MASWLKRAEDLFEVVDRRAKLVVSELADEETSVQQPASNGQGVQSKRKKAKAKSKVQKQASAAEPLKLNDDVGRKPEDSQLPLPDSKSSEVSTSESDGLVPLATTIQTSNDNQNIADNDAFAVDSTSIENLSHDHHAAKPGPDQSEAVPSTANLENTPSFSNPESSTPENSPPPVDNAPRPASQALSIEPLQNDHAAHAGPEVKPEGIDEPLNPDQEKTLPLKAETPVVATNDEKQYSDAAEPLVNRSKQPDQNVRSDQNKEQEQLEEAQGLLKSTTVTGQSKEARLARVCAGLSSRLQEYKSENAQLEELLTAERELSKSYEDHINQLQEELSSTKVEVARVETNMAEALAAKNSEIEALVNSLDALKKQAATSEGNLVSLQANMEALMRNRELSETRMTQALREELASAERRAEEEHTAHNSTKMAAMEREVELERRAVDASTALSRVQRTADERTAKAAELEQRVVLLEVECASLNQELQDMEARVRRGQKKPPEDTSQLIQIQAWQEEVERARQGQRDAESKLSSLEAELQKMRVETAAMKRDAEHYSRQEHMELEKRYRDLTDLLYYKQTQLETMASEKAAAEFQLEKEIKRQQETQAEAERSRVPRRASSSWEEDTDMKDLEPLPLHQRHLVGATTQLRKAAKFLDTGAVRATRFLWRYPTARVILLCYLVFVHLFLMYLLHRLQEQADNFSAEEVAKSMGLSQPNLP